MGSSRFFRNEECEFFPCHKVNDREGFNCLFCYCPLYPYEDCGGNYSINDKGIKDCSECSLPHYNYDYVILRLKNK